MTSLSDILHKIADTQDAMRKMQSLLRENPLLSSLRASYESLHKRHSELEDQFLEIANDQQYDVCTYKLISDENGYYPISSFGDTLKNFQKWFSTVHDALKTGPKTRSRLSVDIIAASTLNFAFSFPGSLGIVMTIPSERQLFENDLQRTMTKSIEMLKAENNEQIANFAKELGIASIGALYSWVENHVNSELGAEIKWITGDTVISDISIGFERLNKLKQNIEKNSEMKDVTFDIRGLLVGADTTNHTFHMVFDEAEEIRGKMSEDIGDAYTVELPKHYIATLKKTSIVNYATEKETIYYFLQSLKKL